MSNKIKRLTKEDTIRKASELWFQFRDRLHGVKHEDYIKEATLEWEKQNKMSDKELKKYRNKIFEHSVSEVRNKYGKENAICDKKEDEFNEKHSK